MSEGRDAGACRYFRNWCDTKPGKFTYGHVMTSEIKLKNDACANVIAGDAAGLASSGAYFDSIEYEVAPIEKDALSENYLQKA